MRYIFRYHSQQWWDWAASIIQVEWRYYCRKKQVREEDNSSQDALAKARIQKRISIILLQRPYEPDFTAEENSILYECNLVSVAHGNSNIVDYNWAARAIQLAWQNYYRKKEEAIRFQDALTKAIMPPKPAEPDITAK
ncbi:Hypothetical predicted protein [Olea europaea subsp. europaea]|uniref:Uncharacterized protein n=1 Tax=Olea europaea subsp. europaea TaxID=158383 RepID=A0A8S0TY63_OLEEU|nr:Hypothetical predicted protein [Olea europaea subsp. europaea]